MTITMQPVKSSQLEAIGHDAVTEILAIRFKGGAIYHYSNVDAAVFANLRDAESVSSYFGKFIKPFPDRFPYQKQAAVTAEKDETNVK